MATARVDMASFKQHLLLFVWPLVGLFFCAYSLMHFYSVKLAHGDSFACNINQTFNCDTVALSAWSELFGVPLGVYGAAYFISLWVLLAVGVSGHKGARDHLLAYVVMNVLGVLVSLGLAAVSHFIVHTWCLSCMGVYAVCLLQAVTLLWQRSKFSFQFSPSPRSGGLSAAFSLLAAIARGGMTALLVVVAAVALHSFAKPRMPHSLPTTDVSGVAGEVEELLLASSEAQQIPINRTPYSGMGEDYRHGADHARVQVVEFIDFQCPSCKTMATTMSLLHKEYEDRVLFVVKNFPLDKQCNTSMQHSPHPHACAIAVLARCAGQFGKFWQYHDLAFAQQHEAGDDTLVAWAQQVGLSDEQITACQASQGILDKIKDDIALARKIGVEATPTVFINGKKYLGGARIDTLRRAIDSMLN